MIRILIADDHMIVREGLKRIIESSGGGLHVVAEAASGQEAVEKGKATRPDVVLLDISMPGRGGLETAQEIKRHDPRVHVVILTVHPEDQFAVRCLKEGADGYLTKDAAPEEIVRAIRKVHGGGKYVSPSLAERLAFSLDLAYGQPPHEALSGRELDVLLRIGAGETVGEIAADLNLSVKTISTYRARVLEKMNMRNNAELMRYVVEHGLG
jgi:DNA-binding NarL/FixJ family response regulator